jgi:predicted short-subunit dehydrogenase-like oxidoreductase (DUF2520 family)
MAADGSRRALFVAALAEGATVNDAATAAGISKRTAWRWHREPEVVAELDRLRRATIRHARDRLLAVVDDAVGWLIDVGANGKADAARVAAGRAVLIHAERMHAVADINERLDRIESVIEAQQRFQGRSA